MQSYECHFRVTNRIEELVDDQLRGLARTMLREHDCRNKLKELPRRIDINMLSMVAGFQLSTEPFFRSLIKAAVKFTIIKQMRKQQIQIPSEKGRTMFGVVDETGQLQYGQIFVQYTENIALKTPPPTASRKVLNGKVLLTKNPCIVAGDVRVFTAVDIPALHHLCDVVVFPMHGPRPHPDEMAGSDLDGDEYAVIWDEDLLLDYNEEPFDYTAEKPESTAVNEETLNDDMIDFYIKYITQDSIGTISNSFLFQADLYGINSEVCQRLAVKISKAVDFTKTGLPPDPLVKEWTIVIFYTDKDSGKEIPPEKSERQPDFHFGNDYDATYRSPRLMGKIYREFKAIEDVLKISEDIDEQDEIECDKYLIVDGWSTYREKAETELAKYNGRLRVLMENYGIKTEGEIFSGCISEMRNRISDRDQDDMSLYNTTEVIERKVTSLFREFREEFFKEFGGWDFCTQKIDKKFAVGENVFHRAAHRPTLKMQQKAVACYRTCYERAQQTRERMLSFAWIAYDILAVVRKENALNEAHFIPSPNPLYKVIFLIFLNVRPLIFLREALDYVSPFLFTVLHFCSKYLA
uniref:RNA-dependent RNA polymerase n=1 Tax=Angiostrongylus cantonensis TaxID=6313 RepID=A0A0K0DQT4_ANGCA